MFLSLEKHFLEAKLFFFNQRGSPLSVQMPFPVRKEAELQNGITTAIGAGLKVLVLRRNIFKQSINYQVNAH